ncbi:putative reverse transcriptase domain-containing protein [Tanacetum coccineum]
MEQIIVMRENNKPDSFSKADFKYLNKNDIKDLYYLCRNKKERVHDFQLGVESYQIKDNLTALTLTFPGIEEHEPYSIVDKPSTDLIYLNSKDEKRVKYLTEIVKFCDATLEKVLKKSNEDHEVHLKLVLELLRKEKLFAKFSKYEFWLQEENFLGHVHEWGMEQEEAFQTLKDNLYNAPILLLPDGVKDFVVYCDASNQGLRCVLMQRGKSSLKEKLLAVQNEAIKEENAPAKMLCGLDQQKKMGDEGLYYMDRIWVPLIGDIKTMIMGEVHATRYSIHLGADKMYYDLRDMYWWPVDRLTKAVHFLVTREDYSMEKLSRLYIDKIMAEVGQNRLIGPEMVQETTNKVALIKEKLKEARDNQKSYANNRRKPLEFEVGDQVLLKVSSWKGAIHFKKKGKLAPRYVGQFEILERIEIKVDKTLRFVKEPEEIMDREVKKLKQSRVPIIKLHWNSKRGPEFT